MTYLRRALTEMADGFRAGLDVLLWGHAYPRTDPALVARIAAARTTRPDPGSST